MRGPPAARAWRGSCAAPPGLSLLLALASAVSGSCTRSNGAKDSLFTDITAQSGIDFRLVTGATGERYLVETMAGGLAWIDHDGDGDCDLYLVNGHSDPLHADEPGQEEDRLYRNEGGGRFTDITHEAGVGDRRYGFGAAVGDYDGDGDADLLVTNFGRNTLYRNEGNGTFADVTEAAGLTETGWSTSAAWFDMDRDGDLDLYVTRYLRYNPRTSRRCDERGLRVYCHPRLLPGMPDLLYRNLGGGRFEEIGARAGIARAGEHEGKGLGVVAADLDGDGLVDLYVANDTTPNFLWRSNGDGTFTDIAGEVGAALSAEGKPQAGMGVDAADVNGDGLLDLHVTNFAGELNSLYLGRGAGQFEEASRAANLGASYLPLGFGTLFVDVDLDGDQDIVTVNGHVNDIVETTDPGSGSTCRQRPALFLNDGKGVFADGAARGGTFFGQAMVGRGLAAADLDGDGQMDLAAMTLDRSLVLLRGENLDGNRSLTLRLAGRRSPHEGYGARIEARAGGKLQVVVCGSARSYLSACDSRVVLGAGKAPRFDLIRVQWPSGRVQELKDVEARGSVTVEEPE